MDSDARVSGSQASTSAPSSVGLAPSAWASALVEVSEALDRLAGEVEGGGVAGPDHAELVAVFGRFRRARERVEVVSHRLRPPDPAR